MLMNSLDHTNYEGLAASGLATTDKKCSFSQHFLGDNLVILCSTFEDAGCSDH